MTFVLVQTQLWAQQVESYSIELEFFPEDAQMWGYKVASQNFVRGNATCKLSEPLNAKTHFFLHGELKIDSISSDYGLLDYESGKEYYEDDYSLIGRKTIFNLPESQEINEVRIYYSGFLSASRSRSLSDYMRADEREGVFLRSYWYSIWFPLFPDEEGDSYSSDFRSVRVTTPEKFLTIVGGEMTKETVENSLRTTEWSLGKADISSLQITSRPFSVLTNEEQLIYYVGDQNKARGILDFCSSLEKVYQEDFRKPDQKGQLYIVEMPEYGDIASGNMIGISEKVFNDFENDDYSKRTIAHEMVHPYVQIPLERNNEFYALVIEGFPSFFHLYAMSKVADLKGFDIRALMLNTEASYMKKKESGLDRRGNPLPEEKPILEISAEEIGNYKDRFILSDRVKLFLYHLWIRMGDKRFQVFLRELFDLDSLDYSKLESLVETKIPGFEKDLNTWLRTNDYPENFRIKK